MRPTSVDEDSVNAAATAWARAARTEWASLLGEDPSFEPPRFRWGPAVGPTASRYAGATALSSLWRNISRRYLEAASIIERQSPDGMVVIRRHMVKAKSAARNASIDETDRHNVSQWIMAADKATAEGDLIVLRRLTAVAAKSASRIEDSCRRRRLVDWKNGLTEGGIDGAPARPTRKAYQWLKGQGHWMRSPVGDPAANDLVRADDDPEEEDPCLAETTEHQSARLWVPKGGEQGGVVARGPSARRRL